MSMIINPYMFTVAGTGNFWQDVNGCATPENGIYHPDGKLTKNAGTGWSTGGAFSINSFDLITGGKATWTLINRGHQIIHGLSRINTGDSYSDIEFGMFTYNTSILDVYESGSFKISSGSGTGSVLFEVRIATSGEVTYWLAGNLVYTSLTTAPAGDWHAKTSIYPDGGIVDGVQLI